MSRGTDDWLDRSLDTAIAVVGVAALVLSLAVLVCLLCLATAHAQDPLNFRRPECQITFTITVAGANQLTRQSDNRQTGCTTWILQYQSTGFTGVNVEADSATSPLNTGLIFVPWQGTVCGGVNPVVSNVGGILYLSNGYFPISWARVKVTTVGAGTLGGFLYGWRMGFGATKPAGCPSP